MAIISNQMQAQQPPRAAAPQPSAQVDPKIIQRIVTAATVALNQDAIEQQIIQTVKAAGNPAQGLAQATVTLMKALYAKSNKTMPPQAIGPAGKEVMLVIAKACEAAGIFKITPQLIQQALAAAVQMLQAAQAAPAQPAAQVPAAPQAAPVAPAQPVGV